MLTTNRIKKTTLTRELNYGIFAGIVLFLNLMFSTNLYAALPGKFQEEVVFSGLTEPTAIRFAPNGEVFIAEKSGIIKRYDNIADTTPEIFADLRTQVFNFWDRGLLGLAIHPQWPVVPHIYVAYTYDADIGGVAPKYGSPGETNDPCLNPLTDGCEVSGRLARLTYDGLNVTETVLIEDWCQVFPSHTVGDLMFGPDGDLFMSAGEGASFTIADFGQFGIPINFCNDPIDEGGALRSQDLSTSDDPLGLSGTILRVDPDSDLDLANNIKATAFHNNPRANADDPNEARIVAYGLRNPYRFTIRPETNEVWIGDVGWGNWEEINRVEDPTTTIINFGWPCLEGSFVQNGYAQQPLCQALINENSATIPYYSYNHSDAIAKNKKCPAGNSAISGITFYHGDTYPNKYNGALFAADFSRNCIWVMFKGSNGLPNPQSRRAFLTDATYPVDLQVGSNGNLFYADFFWRNYPPDQIPTQEQIILKSVGPAPII